VALIDWWGVVAWVRNAMALPILASVFAAYLYEQLRRGTSPEKICFRIVVDVAGVRTEVKFEGPPEIVAKEVADFRSEDLLSKARGRIRGRQ